MMGHATPSVSPDEKGAFRLTQVSPQLYFVAIQNLPEGFYIKSVRMGEAEALENGVDLMRGAPAPLEIVLSPAAAAITGSVKSVKNDADAAAAGATVVLVPQEDARRKQPLFYRSVKTDASGNFTLTGLSPGDYKLYAWMQVETDAWVDSEFLNPLEGKAQPVRLKEGAFEKAELRVIPAER
ncbi:MAG: carboxypeptidase regulatory-like domain-containing protein [Acidobacteriia bacterium]|nr:carboxypeptidase regulatory-like domain-containing protein [Terriglobia bacterium]